MRNYFILSPLMLIASPSIACEFDTPAAWLPGFTRDQTDQRSREILEAGTHVRNYLRVEGNFEKARSVYIARVIRADQINSYKFTARIQPLKALKGTLPTARQLEAENLNSCGYSDGDGDVAFRKHDEIIVVFEGLPIQKSRPRGIDSIGLAEITYGSLLDPLQEWLREQPGYLAQE